MIIRLGFIENIRMDILGYREGKIYWRVYSGEVK